MLAAVISRVWSCSERSRFFFESFVENSNLIANLQNGIATVCMYLISGVILSALNIWIVDVAHTDEWYSVVNNVSCDMFMIHSAMNWQKYKFHVLFVRDFTKLLLKRRQFLYHELLFTLFFILLL